MDGNNAAVQNVQRKEKPQHLFPIGRRRTTTSIERQREHRYSKTSTKFIQNIQVPYSYLWWTPGQWKLQSCAEILSQNCYRWVQRLAKFLRWCKSFRRVKCSDIDENSLKCNKLWASKVPHSSRLILILREGGKGFASGAWQGPKLIFDTRFLQKGKAS